MECPLCQVKIGAPIRDPKVKGELTLYRCPECESVLSVECNDAWHRIPEFEERERRHLH